MRANHEGAKNMMLAPKFRAGLTNDMVRRAQRGDATAIVQVAECFNGIAWTFYHKRIRNVQKYVSEEDFMQMVAAHWAQYLHRFDPERAAATTWAFMICKSVCLRLLELHAKKVKLTTGVVLHDLRPVREVKSSEPVEVRLKPGKRLTAQENLVASMLARGIPRKCIADRLNVVRQRVNQIEDGLREKIVNPWENVKKRPRSPRKRECAT